MAEEADEVEMQQEQTPQSGAQEHGPEPRRRWSKKTAHGEGERQSTDSAASQSAILENFTPEQRAAVENIVAERVAQEQAKADEAVARLLRTQADFTNYKRRNEQEREQQGRFATLMLVSELLPVLDDLDRALGTMPDTVRGLPWTEGLLLVDRHLRATLEKQGLKPIEAVGVRFDPMLHEAIIHEESAEHADDEVIAELRRGYMLHDKVVRPTLVKVAKRVAPTV